MTLGDPTDSFAKHVSDFCNRRVIVLGDAILDEYLLGDCSRISPEAPVPILKVNRTQRVLGGAANTAANIVSLGGHATLIALVGDDEGGATLRRCAADAGVDLQAVDNGAPTLRKTRVVGHQQQIVRLDYEDIRPPDTPTESALFDRFSANLDTCDIVVISDYAKGFLSASLTREIIRHAHRAGRQVIIDPRPQHRSFYVGCDYLTPNWRESRALLGLTEAEPSPETVDVVARTLAAELETNVVLTLGANGISFCSRNTEERFSVPTMAKEVFDVSGAGDTVVAAFALAIASRADHVAAVALANRAASVVVGKFGTATVVPEEMLQDTDALRLVPRRALTQLASTLRAKGKRIVTINGAFDLMHGGHLHILNEAKRQGDVLIVGLNSDQSVRSYKGPTRPLVPERRRAEMLLALRMVDYVHIFDEENPIAFLREVNPDVHVNGAEYGSTCVEAETVRRGGGRLHLVDRIANLSTSGLLHAMSNTAVPVSPDAN
jgi:D-beta-D-heptose 7-phosphate kinase/D-beta-D-heptose 1-phosphate adenosyltransferase